MKLYCLLFYTVKFPLVEEVLTPWHKQQRCRGQIRLITRMLLYIIKRRYDIVVESGFLNLSQPHHGGAIRQRLKTSLGHLGSPDLHIQRLRIFRTTPWTQTTLNSRATPGIDKTPGIHLSRVSNLDRLPSDLVLNLFWKLDQLAYSVENIYL